ncbi:MAG TPA: rhodanese-like domain-containing protein [Steroidobacteraceae bacterium]|nr:rhodanese-like domain-containing protein [Steroidobacteraceae bacterium]
MVAQVSPRELKARLDAGERPDILDVREAWELAVAQLPEVIHIPMGELARRMPELDPGRELIVMCRSGGRSMQVAQSLESRGFERIANLDGGILAWSRDVDPSVAVY